jgi:hypothetical protein
MHTLILQGRRLPENGGGASGDGGPRTYGAGRRCAADGCDTILSSYNPSALCSLHAGGWDERPPREPRHSCTRPEQTRRCANALCSVEFTTANPSRVYCSDRCRMKAFQLRLARQRRRAAA